MGLIALSYAQSISETESIVKELSQYMPQSREAIPKIDDTDAEKAYKEMIDKFKTVSYENHRVKLINILLHSKNTQFRAVAALTLSFGENLDDIEHIEKLLRDTSSKSFFLPHLNICIQCAAEDPIHLEWKKTSLKELALIVLERITTINFHSVDEYFKNPPKKEKLVASVKYWSKILEDTLHFDQKINQLKEKPELFIHVMITYRYDWRDAKKPYYGLPENEVINIVKKTYSSKELLSFLKKEKKFSLSLERDEISYDNFYRWLCARAHTFFDESYAQEFYNLWKKNTNNAFFALAATSLNPKLEFQILKQTMLQAIAKKPLDSGAEETIVRQIASGHLEEGTTVLKDWYYSKEDPFHSHEKVFLFEVLSQRGSTAIPLIKEIVFDKRFESDREYYISALLDFALSLKAPVSVDYRKDIHARYHPLYKKGMTKEEEQQAHVDAQKKRETCFKEIKNWLAQN